MPVEYQLIATVGDETPRGNPAFEQLSALVNGAIQDGWQPVGGVSIAPVAGLRIVGSQRENWFLRVAQAMVRGAER